MAFDLGVAISAGVLGLTSLGLLILRATRPASLSELLTVLVVAALAGSGALAMSRMTDDAVAVYGETIYCQTPEFEDPPPAEVQDRGAGGYTGTVTAVDQPSGDNYIFYDLTND